MGYMHGVENEIYIKRDIHKVESLIYTQSEK